MLDSQVIRLLDAPSRVSARRDASGLLRVPARIARSGVQVYVQPDGTRMQVLRPASEVFAPEAVASFEGAPLTLGHPAAGEVTSETYQALARGAAASVHQDAADPRWLAATVAVHDAAAIAAVEVGTVQLSCGYSAQRTLHTPPVEWTDPVDGQVYAVDATLSNIRGNHVALCDSARAGPGARLLLDAAAYWGVAVEDAPRPVKVIVPMADEKKPVERPLAEQVADAVSVEAGKHAAAIEAMKKEYEGKLEALAQKLAKATDPAFLDALVTDTLAVREAAAARAVDVKGLSLDAAKRAVIKAAMPGLVLDSFGAEQLSGLFASLPPVPAAAAPKPEQTGVPAVETQPNPIQAALADRAKWLGC